MRRRVTLSFLIWTFTISYIMWGTIIISNQFSYLEFGSPISMILFIIGGNAPAIVAYFILKKERRVDSFGQFVKRAFAIKQKLLYYFLLLIFCALYFGVPYLMKGITKEQAFYYGLLNIPMMIFLGGLEELGWRNILQPELEEKFSFGIASVLTSLIWAIWHLPLFFIAGTSQSGMNFGLFTVMIFGMSFALASIYYVSKSIWLCILFHTIINAFSSIWIINEDILTRVITLVVLIIFSFILVIYSSIKRKSLLNNQSYIKE